MRDRALRAPARRTVPLSQVDLMADEPSGLRGLLAPGLAAAVLRSCRTSPEVFSFLRDLGSEHLLKLQRIAEARLLLYDGTVVDWDEFYRVSGSAAGAAVPAHGHGPPGLLPVPVALPAPLPPGAPLPVLAPHLRQGGPAAPPAAAPPAAAPKRRRAAGGAAPARRRHRTAPSGPQPNAHPGTLNSADADAGQRFAEQHAHWQNRALCRLWILPCPPVRCSTEGSVSVPFTSMDDSSYDSRLRSCRTT